MVNKMKKLVLIIVLLICIFITSCKSSDKTNELTPELEKEIKTFCYNYHNEHGLFSSDKKDVSLDTIQIMAYLGNYGKDKNLYVVIIKDIIVDYGSEAEIGRPYYIVIVYNYSKPQQGFGFPRLPEVPFVIDMQNNTFYTLQFAVDNNILTVDDMMKIHSEFEEN